MDLEIIRNFSSRHNTIKLARDNSGNLVVYKRYKNIDNMVKEASLLKRFSLCGYAPRVMEQGNDYLVNEYIDGELFFSRFRLATMTDDIDELVHLASQLSVFLQIFYSVFDGYILGDINLKNFIIKDNRCYGIDYEAVTTGMYYQDVAGIIACALLDASSDPSCALPFIKAILDDFHLVTIDIINEVRTALQKKAENYGIACDIEVLVSILMYFGDKQSDEEGMI